MRANLLLASVSISVCFSALTLANYSSPLVSQKSLSPRATIQNCGPYQNRTLSALLVEIANWSDYALNGLRLHGAADDEILLSLNTFGYGLRERRRTPERKETRRRYEALRWEVERSPWGRVRRPGRVMFTCSTCATEFDRTGYDLFAIRKGRILGEGMEVIKIVSVSLHCYFLPKLKLF